MSPETAESTSAEEQVPPAPDDEAPWQRLSARMIWVDLVQSLLALSPGAIAIWVVGVPPSAGTLWPLGIIAVVGVVGAVADVLRWVFTRYRVTGNEVQRRTGVLVRRSRTVRHDRIRSVDTHAKLRHRLAGLRVVTVGAGQQTTSGEAAFVLDALTRDDAEQLRRQLLRKRRVALVAAAGDAGSAERSHDDGGAGDDGDALGSADGAPAEDTTDDGQVLATLRPWWVVYNIFSIFAYLTAAGVLWGAYWLAATFGVDLLALVSGLADWESIGVVRTVAVAAVATGAVGAVGMAVSFFTASWNFELTRLRDGDGSVLRTRRGLLSTREVNRDESRMRGMTISEPVLWRWMGMADTTVITTGLGLWSAEQPSAILPRGPVSVARPVAATVLGETTSPLDLALPRHPRAALRRRLTWATVVVAVLVALVAWPVRTGAAPGWLLWSVVALWPFALLCAVVAYRALGHVIAGDYLVTRSGLVSRATTALRRDAVSTIAVRQSVLQRRLGLATVSTMTAAGWGVYEAPDLDADDALGFAAEAAPGLLSPFLEPVTASAGR